LDQDSVQQIVERADELYLAREDIQNVWTSVELLQRALSQVDSYGLAWRLGRAFFFLGQEESEVATARVLHAQGVDAGKRAVEVGPERVEGHFWLGVNLALLAVVEQPLKAIAHALQAKRSLNRTVTIDPAYHAAGPLRALARLQHKAPRWLGGDTVGARENYERAIDIAANNTVTRIYFAELLLEIGEIVRGRSELEAVLNAPFDPAWAFEIERDRKIAREFLKNRSEKITEQML
jgi:tetratricopeptide (TPR) repeat protein